MKVHQPKLSELLSIEVNPTVTHEIVLRKAACMVAGRPVRELVGSYYAERGGSGRITAVEHSPEVAGSLARAGALSFETRRR
jgi:hypothetical protein